MSKFKLSSSLEFLSSVGSIYMHSIKNKSSKLEKKRQLVGDLLVTVS